MTWLLETPLFFSLPRKVLPRKDDFHSRHNVVYKKIQSRDDFKDVQGLEDFKSQKLTRRNFAPIRFSKCIIYSIKNSLIGHCHLSMRGHLKLRLQSL